MSDAFAFLGTGSMGGAILDGLLATHPGATVRATTRTSMTPRARVESRSVNEFPDANRWAVNGADIVVVGVKPFAVIDLLESLRDVLRPDVLIVSVAAGLTLSTMESVVPNPIVRAMPNTPALVGKGVTGIARGSRVTELDAARARSLFEAVGWVIELPEDQIDALSTISGSGPAYVFHAIERWTDAAMRLGFTRDTARALVEKTFTGALALLDHSGEEPRELRRRVTSPNGTTERAIGVLEAAHLDDVFTAAAEAALARAREIAAQLER